MKKVQITVSRVYPNGKKGNSRSMTIKGLNVTPAFNKIAELFKEERI